MDQRKSNGRMFSTESKTIRKNLLITALHACHEEGSCEIYSNFILDLKETTKNHFQFQFLLTVDFNCKIGRAQYQIILKQYLYHFRTGNCCRNKKIFMHSWPTSEAKNFHYLNEINLVPSKIKKLD